MPAGVQVGDILIGVGYRGQNATPVGVPSGWTAIDPSSGSSNNSSRIGFRYVTNVNDSLGNWASANRVIIVAYRGVRSDYSESNLPNFGGVWTGTNATLAFPSLSLTGTTNTSHILWFGGRRGSTTFSVPGWTRSGTIRNQSAASNGSVVALDTNGVTNDGSSIFTTTNASNAYRTYAIEVESDGIIPPPTVTITSPVATLALNATTTVTWSSTDADSCTASDGWSGIKATSGTEVTSPIIKSTLFVITCENAQGFATAEVRVTPGINVDNVLNTNEGFQVYAFNPDGSPSTIARRTTAPEGYGVTGAVRGADIEIGNAGTGSELLRIIFDNPATSTQIQIAWSQNTDPAAYALYDAAGNLVATGQIPSSASDQIEEPVTINSGGLAYSRIDFTANDNRDYLIHSVLLPNGLTVGTSPLVTSMAAVGTNATREYVVSDTDGLIQLIGTDFDATAGSVVFSGTWGSATGTLHTTAEGSCAVGGWTDTSVCSEVPTSIPDDVYSVTVTLVRDDGKTATAPTLAILPRITSTSPGSVAAGDTFTISGDHLCQSGICPTSFDGANTITIGGVETTLVSWSHTEIVVTVPSGLSAGTHSVAVTTGGISVSAGAVIFVPPPTVILTAATTTVAVGTATTLSWSSTDTASCTASGGWSGSKPVNGLESTGAINGVTTFTLTCTNIAGTATSSVTISTVSAASVTLSASPTSVPLNGTSTLSWTSSDATSCAASGGWSGTKSTNGTEATSALATTTLFVLECSNLAGTTTATTSVTVVEPPILSGTNGGYVNTTNNALIDGGRIGDSITISGANFGTQCDVNNFIAIGNYTVPCSSVTNWTDTEIVFTIPAGITNFGGIDSLGLTVTASGQNSESVTFIIYPDITAVAAEGTNTGKEGSYIQLIGTAFGASEGTVTFSGSWGTTTAVVSSTAQGSCTSGGWTNTSVCVQVPASVPDDVYSATITLTRTDSKEDTAPTFTLLPHITATAPSSGVAGDTITISGDHLCQSGICPTAFDGANTITIGGVTAEFVSWSHTGIVVLIPPGVPTGSNTIVVTTGGISVAAGTVTILTTEPNAPSLGPSATTGQFSGGTSISIGGATASSTITFAAAMSAQISASLTLEVEVKPVGSAFDGINTNTSSVVNYTGTTIIGSVTEVLDTNMSYHWRARVRNTSTNEVSVWVAFGSNPAGDGSGDGLPANADFTIATDGPELGGVGTAPNCSAHDLVKDTSARISWTASSILTPIQNKVRVATSSNMANFLEYQASNGTSPQVTLTGLTAETAYFYQVISQDSLGTESIAQENDPHCTFITEEASKRINKLSEFYICQMHEQDEVWTGGSGVTCASEQDGAKTFNVFVSEMIASKPVVQTSAFVEVFGIAEASTDFTVTVNVNNLGPKTITVKNPQGSIPYRVLYHLPDGYNLDFPADISASNLLDVQINGADAVSSMGAKAILNYYYFPTY